MGNLALFANLIASFSASNVSFTEVYPSISTEDIVIMQENNIKTWEDLYDYTAKNSSTKSNEKGSYSEAITDVHVHLEKNYPDYSWIQDEDDSALTSDVSGAIPIEMGGSGLFPESDIQAAIDIAGVRDETEYGGCGPIALLGIIDYFARYLGFDEFISDPTSSSERIALAAEVFSLVNFSIFGNANSTIVWPESLQSCLFFGC